jgi:acyl phosphate:glycerol-3-phosphate acyltransferase
VLAFPCFLVGYLVGSIPIGLLVGQLAAGIDIRRYGTGNIGASNTFRNLGVVPAAVVGIGSFLQGFGPAWVAGRLTGSELCEVAAGVGAVAGYGWSLFLRLRGGSAVGTATGALAAFSPSGLVALLVCYALGGLIRRPAPLVLLGLVVYLIYVVVIPRPVLVVLGAAVTLAMVITRRLDGVRDDLLEDPDHHARVLLDRLIHDRRPGQRLHGPATR